ncbi:acyl-CoA N-acyltransferase [Trichocladium antarcticum]|uniref:Acyl-CoA N-acyltransferase n=1 Tax=Trichocladium antarcticum TaxID=1450529 RepID=A0AAN6UER6_9PEZI|nr:acyl-CoA N-acyltransferase [Trichocladium antarcticum]
MIIRPATPSDLDAMTWVLAGASSLDPASPDRDLYASEFASLCQQQCAEHLATSTVVVCEMPNAPTNPASPTRVVAFSAWDLPTPSLRTPSLRTPTHSPTPTPHTVRNHRRQTRLRATLAAHKSLLLDTPARPAGGHVFLQRLAVHPSHQRRGAGARLVAWGIGQARERGVCATVLAGAPGLARLYRRLGFGEVGRFCVPCGGGETGEVEVVALVVGRGLVGGVREGERCVEGGRGEGGVRVVGTAGGAAGMVCGRKVGDCVGRYEAAACA